MVWITVTPKGKEELAAPGLPVLCKIQHWYTKGEREYLLVRVLEDDCSWRTADDNSELSHDWNVVAWLKE